MTALNSSPWACPSDHTVRHALANLRLWMLNIRLDGSRAFACNLTTAPSSVCPQTKHWLQTALPALSTSRATPTCRSNSRTARSAKRPPPSSKARATSRRDEPASPHPLRLLIEILIAQPQLQRSSSVSEVDNDLPETGLTRCPRPRHGYRVSNCANDPAQLNGAKCNIYSCSQERATTDISSITGHTLSTNARTERSAQELLMVSERWPNQTTGHRRS